MNRKGYTLIELLTGVSVIGIILVMVGCITLACLAIPKCSKAVEEHGVKGIVESVWYGDETNKVETNER
jgi:prepilin-type N-terminal cleavage/methylation domain-containing protein